MARPIPGVVGKKSGDFVFTAPMGIRLSNRKWRRRNFERAMGHLVSEHPDITRLTPHDLRHAASLAISVGANVLAVQRVLRHASAAMRLDVHIDLFDDDLDAVAMR